MSENPYAAEQHHPPASDFGSDFPKEPGGTSVLAIIAFVVALISIVGCCVPGLPMLGAVLGVFAMIGIARSGGRKRGTGFAVAAIVIGILMSVVQTVGYIVTNQGLGQLATLTESLEELERDDFDALRARLPNADDRAVTDERLRAFRAAYTAALGEHDAAPDSLFGMFGSYAEAGQQFQQMGQPDWPYPSNSIPLASRFGQETALIVFVPDPTAASTPDNPMPLENIGIVASDGSVFWLIDPNASAPDAPPEDEPAPDQTPDETGAPNGGDNGNGNGG